MTTEEILTLTRLAQKYPEYSRVLLDLIERVLTNGHLQQPETTQKAPAAGGAMPFPIEVFHVFHKGKRNGERITGKLFSNATLEVRGRLFDSPSGAGTHIAGCQVNGLKWWLYEDPLSGQVRPVGYLRQRGLIR